MKNTMVTVLMPVYNGERYLKESIESILSQTYKNFEFLIIDDGSTDNSSNIIDSFNDKRIRKISNKVNLGLVKSLNKGLRLACGKYIVRMDSDDLSEKNRIEKQVEYMENNLDVAVLGSAVRLIDENNQLGRNIVYPLRYIDILWSLYFGSPLAHPSVIMRSSVVKKIGGYGSTKIATNREKYSVEDFDLWFRLSKVSKLINLDTCLLKLRKHNKNLTVVNRDEHLTNTGLIIKHNLMHDLGINISEEMAIGLTLLRMDNKFDYIKLIELVNNIYKKFINARKNMMTKDDINIIKDNKTSKIILIGFNTNNIFIVFKIIFIEFLKNPTYLYRKLLSKIFHEST